MKTAWTPIFFIYIMTIYRECLISQLFSRGMHTHFPIQTRVQYGCIGHKKTVPFS